VVGDFVMITTLDWLISVLLPALFTKLDNYFLVSGVSVLGIAAAGFVIWFLYRRLL